jgi:hypothetical protein
MPGARPAKVTVAERPAMLAVTGETVTDSGLEGAWFPAATVGSHRSETR